MNNKIIMIVGIVLIVVSVALSAVSLIMLNQALNTVNTDTIISGQIDEEVIAVPIALQTKYEMAESIIGIYRTDSGTLNVSVRIGFGVYAENRRGNIDQKAVDEVIVLIQENEGALRDRISKLLSSKNYDYMTQDGIEQVLQAEMLEMVQYELQTESVVAIYFPDGILRSFR